VRQVGHLLKLRTRVTSTVRSFNTQRDLSVKRKDTCIYNRKNSKSHRIQLKTSFTSLYVCSFVCSLFLVWLTTHITVRSVASKRQSVNDELEWAWKRFEVTQFQVLLQHLYGRTEEKNEKISELSVSKRRFEPGIS